MSAVYKRKKRIDGKVVSSRSYYCRIAGKQINLHYTDKQAAQAKAKQLYEEKQRIDMGIAPPKAVQEAAKTPLVELLRKYVSNLSDAARSTSYINQSERRIKRLIAECGWNFLKDISKDSFRKWNTEHKSSLGDKTRYEHLNQTNAFLNWIVRNELYPQNPLKNLEIGFQKSDIDKRAFTEFELRHLFEIAGQRRIVYLLATYTGLRRNELRSLVWHDFKVQRDEGWFEVRPSTTKSRKAAILPVPPALLNELLAHRPANYAATASILKGLVPRTARFRKDLSLAGIAHTDELGRTLCFHSLRRTYCTLLQKTGADRRTVMELTRHADPRLTDHTYTDTTQLSTFQAVAKLPVLWSSDYKVTEKVTVKAVVSGQKLSSGVTDRGGDEYLQLSDDDTLNHEMATVGTNCQSVENMRAEGFEPPTPSV